MTSCYIVVVCLFKPKTAYEMRISDWSSDVCSSDLFDITDSLTFRASVLAAQRNYRRISNVTALRTARVPATNPFYVDPVGTGQPVQVTYNFVNDVDRKSTRLNSSH